METHVTPSSSPSYETQARRFPRVPFHTPVRITRLATGQSLELVAHNLSETGLFIETVIPFTVGELFRLSFPAAPEELEEVAVARVVWRRAFTPLRSTGAAPGIGLAFLLMRPGDRRQLATLVDAGGVQPLARPPLPAPRPARSGPPPARRTIPSMMGLVTSVGENTVDLSPSGWLLLAALSMAAIASLLAGLQPIP